MPGALAGLQQVTSTRDFETRMRAQNASHYSEERSTTLGYVKACSYSHNSYLTCMQCIVCVSMFRDTFKFKCCQLTGCCANAYLLVRVVQASQCPSQV